MSFDISHLLDSWDYKPGQVAVRKFRANDGLEKIQLRVDLGVLQMNASGRPDGQRPFGKESMLEHYKQKASTLKIPQGEGEVSLNLDAETCSSIHQEIVQYHHRYICLYQLGEYDAVIRDTNRNDQAIQFVQQHAASEELSAPLFQFKPQLMMMRVRARGAISLMRKAFDEAIETVQGGIEEIREFYMTHTRIETPDTTSEIRSLEGWLEEIRGQRPRTDQEKLETALSEAVAAEDYEKAAKVRDAIRSLKTR